MSAVLYLLPNRITESATEETIPQATLSAAHRCRRFLAENAKSARAFLKAIEHPVAIADLEIIEIGHVPDKTQFDAWLKPVLDGTDTAIVSESGCPGVADPGADIAGRAHELGIRVQPLVGPCSILMTLMASGLFGQCFRFSGYLPINESERAQELKRLEAQSAHGQTELFIETPYRNNRMLAAMTEVLRPDTRVTVATDVSGKDERIRTMRVSEWKDHLNDLPKLPTVFALLAQKETKSACISRETQVSHRSNEKRRIAAGAAKKPHRRFSR